MASELTLRADGRAEMAFADYSGTPWHRMGQRVTKGASIEVWKKEAGLDWEAHSTTPHVGGASLGFEIEFEDHKAIWRSDTKAPLAIVGEGYNIVQPGACLEFFRDMTESGGWHIHTAGTLRGGRKIWAMASRGEYGAIKGTVTKSGKSRRTEGTLDEVHNNLLLATSLDGSMKTTVADTSVSVVCANTLRAALSESEGNGRVITVSHRSVFDEAAVKRVLGLAGDAFEKFMRKAQDLADTPCDMREARAVLDKVFGVEAPKVDTSWMGKLAELGKQPAIPDESRVVGAVLDLFEGGGMGALLPSRKGTRWGLLNAVTQHVDHGMGRTADTRLDAAWFGRGDAFKTKALELLSA